MSIRLPEKWRLVVIESPYAGDVVRNVAFCRNVCRYAVTQGCAPYASHLLFTQFLDDDLTDERAAGIFGGLAWSRHAEEAWFCLREGDEFSRGMQLAWDRHGDEGRTRIVLRFTQHGELIREEDVAA